MTTSSYSTDLRIRVIEYLKEGGNYKEALLTFKVSISAIGRWYRRYKKEQNYEARKRGGSRRKIDLKMLEQYVQSNPNMHLKEASTVFNVSIFTISYWLKSLGYSYKKKTSPTWKQMKKSEILTKKP